MYTHTHAHTYKPCRVASHRIVSCHIVRCSVQAMMIYIPLHLRAPAEGSETLQRKQPAVLVVCFVALCSAIVQCRVVGRSHAQNQRADQSTSHTGQAKRLRPCIGHSGPTASRPGQHHLGGSSRQSRPAECHPGQLPDNPMLANMILCCYALLCYALLCCTRLCSILMCSTLLLCTVLRCATLCSSVLYSAVVGCAMLCFTLMCLAGRAMLCCAVRQQQQQQQQQLSPPHPNKQTMQTNNE